MGVVRDKRQCRQQHGQNPQSHPYLHCAPRKISVALLSAAGARLATVATVCGLLALMLRLLILLIVGLCASLVTLVGRSDADRDAIDRQSLCFQTIQNAFAVVLKLL